MFLYQKELALLSLRHSSFNLDVGRLKLGNVLTTISGGK